MMTTMRATMLVMPSDESDLPLFDDVKKGESYLLRETPYFVYLYFVVFSVVGHLYLVFMSVWTCTCLCWLCFVFHFYFMT